MPGGAAVLSDDPASRDVVGFMAIDPLSWTDGASMGIQLWQRRQTPGDPGSRHFQAPETKSDSTPNPRTAPLLGPSLYEGHVTLELALGRGERRLAFIIADKGKEQAGIPDAFKAAAKKLSQ